MPAAGDMLVNWMGAQFRGINMIQQDSKQVQQWVMMQLAHMKDWTLLDSQSTVNLFCNPGLVKDIQEPTSKLALAMNAGNMMVKQDAMVKDFGRVWFDQNAMTNMFSLASMEDKC